MKTGSIIALATVAIANDTAPKEGCCTPMSAFETTPPTKAWMCAKLKDTYKAASDNCLNQVDEEFKEMGVDYNDPTWNDSYTSNFKIGDKRAKIDKWFDYFCKDDAGSSNAQVLAQVSDGEFNGDWEDKKNWDLMYKNVFYEISRHWEFCQHKGRKAMFQFEKVGNEEGVKAVQQVMVHLKK
jgi:hypothetical protein